MEKERVSYFELEMKIYRKSKNKLIIMPIFPSVKIEFCKKCDNLLDQNSKCYVCDKKRQKDERL